MKKLQIQVQIPSTTYHKDFFVGQSHSQMSSCRHATVLKINFVVSAHPPRQDGGQGAGQVFIICVDRPNYRSSRRGECRHPSSEERAQHCHYLTAGSPGNTSAAGVTLSQWQTRTAPRRSPGWVGGEEALVFHPGVLARLGGEGKRCLLGWLIHPLWF